MSLSNPKSQTGNVSKAREKLLNELNVIREREVELLRAELRNKDDEVRVRKEELHLQAEELEAQLDELRTTNEEMESIIRQCKVAETQLKEVQANLKLVLESTDEGIMQVDPGGVCRLANASASTMLGYMQDELVGKQLQYLTRHSHPDGTACPIEECGMITVIRTGEGNRVLDEVFYRKDGTAMPVEYSAYPIRENDAITGAVISFYDITRRKELEEEMRQKNEELEVRAEELKAQREECLAKNAELEVQARERKRVEAELNDAKTQAELYLELMGHDISNMHQVIMSQLEMAREKLDTNGKLKAADRELIDNSISTLDRSARLIENVQNLQKLRSGEFKEEVIDLDDLLASIAKEYGKILPSGSIKFARAGPCPVRANKLIHDVFTNLVGNAVKHYNGNNIKIGIGLKKVREDDKDQYRVFVEDNGSGIPDSLKDKIFNRLQRGETKARGMGLGLYLVKSLVDSYHGRVWVEDRVLKDHTKGSRFVVILPAEVRRF